MLAIVDASPLFSAADMDDGDHERCIQVFQRTDLEFVVPALVVGEVTYMLGRWLGATTEAEFLNRLSAYEVEAPRREDWPAIAALVQQYADFPLGGTDASVAVLAERLGTDLIVTLDHRHFRAVRRSDGRPFTLLPD